MTDEYDHIVVTIAHLRMANMCAREPRQWMKRHGLNWSTFVTEGYSVSVLRQTDALAEPVIRIAIEESTRGR